MSLPVLVAALAILQVMAASAANAADPNGICQQRGIRSIESVRKSMSPLDLIASVRAAYSNSKTYADSGAVMVETKPIGATAFIERHRFVTRYQAPRNFYFEFTKNTMAGNETVVIWSPGDAFRTWWSATKVAEVYPPGRGANAFAVNTLTTEATVLLIPPLLFGTADLTGPVRTLEAAEFESLDEIGASCTFVVAADIRLNHWSDATRKTRIWIDSDSMLILQVVEETPSNASADQVNRRTISLSPSVDIDFDESSFDFDPPGS